VHFTVPEQEGRFLYADNFLSRGTIKKEIKEQECAVVERLSERADFN
jgi:hypothetical protein